MNLETLISLTTKRSCLLSLSNKCTPTKTIISLTLLTVKAWSRYILVNEQTRVFTQNKFMQSDQGTLFHSFSWNVHCFIGGLIQTGLNKTWQCINNVCCDSLMSLYFCVTHYCNSEPYSSNSIFILAFKWREHTFGLQNALPPRLQMAFSYIRFSFMWKHKLHVHKLMGGYN